MGRVQTPYDELTYRIIGLAMAIHKELGPGFPEEVYQRAMVIAMTDDGVPFEREFPIELQFREQPVGKFELGLLINFGAASLEYKRIFPPKAVQSSSAFQKRRAPKS